MIVLQFGVTQWVDLENHRVKLARSMETSEGTCMMSDTEGCRP